MLTQRREVLIDATVHCSTSKAAGNFSAGQVGFRLSLEKIKGLGLGVLNAFEDNLVGFLH